MNEQKAISRLKRMLSCNDSMQAHEAINHAIFALEKQLNNGWIPVRERLPEDNTAVIVTDADLWVGEVSYGYTDDLHKTCFHHRWDDESEHEFNNVIAWQPLPEPYKEESNENIKTH